MRRTRRKGAGKCFGKPTLVVREIPAAWERRVLPPSGLFMLLSMARVCGIYTIIYLYYSLCIIQLSDFGAIRKGLAHQVYRSQARTNFPSASRCCPSCPVELPHFATLTRARMDRSYANTHSVPLTTLRARQSYVDVAVGTRSTWSWGLQRRQIDAELDQRHTFPASRHHCEMRKGGLRIDSSSRDSA